VIAPPEPQESSEGEKMDIESVLKRHPGATRDSLIPILQEVQEQEGYLSQEMVVRIGAHLKLPVSKVYGVATFYNQFRFQPRGRFHFMVCRGTACHVKGSAKLLETVCKALKLEPGKTSRDKAFSLEVVACMGACGLAPVVNVNGEFFAKVTPKKLSKIVEDCRAKERESTRVEA
jgi:NADH-quinone oxidoreductase subunit E